MKVSVIRTEEGRFSAFAVEQILKGEHTGKEENNCNDKSEENGHTRIVDKPAGNASGNRKNRATIRSGGNGRRRFVVVLSDPLLPASALLDIHDESHQHENA